MYRTGLKPSELAKSQQTSQTLLQLSLSRIGNNQATRTKQGSSSPPTHQKLTNDNYSCRKRPKLGGDTLEVTGEYQNNNNNNNGQNTHKS